MREERGKREGKKEREKRESYIGREKRKLVTIEVINVIVGVLVVTFRVDVCCS